MKLSKNKFYIILSIFITVACIAVVAGTLTGLAFAPQKNLSEGNNNDGRILLSPAHYKGYIFKQGERSFAYRLREPIETSDGTKKPLIVYLHGNGVQGDDNRSHVDFSFTEAADNFAKDCYILMPQCGTGGRWDDYTFDDYTRIVNDCIDEYIVSTYNIDVNRIYITGVSMGGFGVVNAVQLYPDRFAAGAIVCGGNNNDDYDDFKNMPLWIAHGDADDTVSVEYARTFVSALEKLGNNQYKYTEYAGRKHDIAATFYNTPEVWSWIKAQKK